MDKGYDTALHNRSDMFFGVIYNTIIPKIIDALYKEDIYQSHRMIKSLLVYTVAFFSDPKNKQNLVKIKETLSNCRDDIINIENSSNNLTQQQVFENAKRRGKIIDNLEQVLEMIFFLMRKHGLMVYIKYADSRPMVVKDMDN